MNLDEIIDDIQKEASMGAYEFLDIKECKRAMREAVKQALELAAERAEVKPVKMGQYHGTDKYGYFVDKQSILNIMDEIE